MPGSSRLTEEQKAELARAARLEKETDEQKWIRTAIREELRDELRELFTGDPDDDGKPKASGPGAILSGLFGKTG